MSDVQDYEVWNLALGCSLSEMIALSNVFGDENQTVLGENALRIYDVHEGAEGDRGIASVH